MLICYESDVLILSLLKTDSEDVITRLLYLYLEYLRFLETSDILILVHYIVWHSLFVLESGLFKFVKLDDKALQPIALLFWLPTLNRSTSILFGSLDTDSRKWFVHFISDTFE